MSRGNLLRLRRCCQSRRILRGQSRRVLRDRSRRKLDGESGGIDREEPQMPASVRGTRRPQIAGLAKDTVDRQPELRGSFQVAEMIDQEILRRDRSRFQRRQRFGIQRFQPDLAPRCDHRGGQVLALRQANLMRALAEPASQPGDLVLDIVGPEECRLDATVDINRDVILVPQDRHRRLEGSATVLLVTAAPAPGEIRRVLGAAALEIAAGLGPLAGFKALNAIGGLGLRRNCGQPHGGPGQQNNKQRRQYAPSHHVPHSTMTFGMRRVTPSGQHANSYAHTRDEGILEPDA